MPVFATRWKDMTLSLVEAENESTFLAKMVSIYGESETQSLSFRQLENPLVLTLQLTPKFLESEHGVESQENALAALREDQRRLMEDNLFKDFTVVVEGEEVSCHRAVLACCDYYRKMLTSNMNEVGPNRLTLKGTSAAVFKLCLEYQYCREITFTGEETIEQLCELLRYAHMIDLPGVVSLAASGIEKMLIKEGVTCLHLQATSRPVVKYTRHVNGVQEVARLLQLRHLDQSCSEIRARWPESWNSSLNSQRSASGSLVKKLEAILSNASGEACLNDLGDLLGSVGKEDFGSVSPYLVAVLCYARDGHPSGVKYQSVIRMLHGREYPIDKTMEIVVSDTSGCRAKISCTPLLAAASLDAEDLVDLFLELGADPLASVLPTGRTVLHFLENQADDSDDHILRDVIAKLLKKTVYKTVGEIPFAPVETSLSVDGFYARHVLEEFLTPLSERGQAVEFTLAVDNEGCPERLVLDELRAMVHPKLQSLWLKNMEEQRCETLIDRSRRSKPSETEDGSTSREKMSRSVLDAIEEDYNRARQYDHPCANNEDAILVLSIDDLERACAQQSNGSIIDGM